MEQKIIIKKLHAHAGTETAIKDKFANERGNVEIPEGWVVKQVSTTPIEKGGDTKHIALTMLLEKAE